MGESIKGVDFSIAKYGKYVDTTEKLVAKDEAGKKLVKQTLKNIGRSLEVKLIRIGGLLSGKGWINNAKIEKKIERELELLTNDIKNFKGLTTAVKEKLHMFVFDLTDVVLKLANENKVDNKIVSRLEKKFDNLDNALKLTVSELQRMEKYQAAKEKLEKGLQSRGHKIMESGVKNSIEFNRERFASRVNDIYNEIINRLKDFKSLNIDVINKHIKNEDKPLQMWKLLGVLDEAMKEVDKMSGKSHRGAAGLTAGEFREFYTTVKKKIDDLDREAKRFGMGISEII